MDLVATRNLFCATTQWGEFVGGSRQFDRNSGAFAALHGQIHWWRSRLGAQL